MQAIILAAGMGRRLGAYTKNNTKCMVPVNGVKLIDRVLTQLSQLNLQRVIIVVGYKGQELIKYLDHRYDDKLKIEFVNNPIYDRTNNIYSLSLVKEQMQEDVHRFIIRVNLLIVESLFGNKVYDVAITVNAHHGAVHPCLVFCHQCNVGTLVVYQHLEQPVREDKV